MHYVGTRVMEMKLQVGRRVECLREDGCPLDRVRDDIKEKGLSADEVYDRARPFMEEYAIAHLQHIKLGIR